MLINIYFITILLLSTACNSGGGNNSGSKTVERIPLGTFSGTYKGECVDYENSSVRESFSFDNSFATLESITYSGSACQDINSYQKNRIVYTYTFEKPELRLINKNKFYQFYQVEDADEGNNSNWCELTNWIAGVEQEVTSLDCGGDTFWPEDEARVDAEIISSTKIKIDSAYYERSLP